MKGKTVIRSLAGAISVLLLAAFALLALLLTLGVRVDIGFLRSTLERAAAGAAGRQVTLAGPLTVKLSLFPVVEAGGVRVAGSGDDAEDLLRLGLSKLQVSLPSLLRKEILVTAISSESVDVSLAGGSAGPGGTAPGAAGRGGEASTGFRFSGVQSFSFPVIDIRYGASQREPPALLSLQEIEGSALPGVPLTVKGCLSFRRQTVSAAVTMPPFDTLRASGSPWPLKVRAAAPGVEAAATILGGGSAEGGWLEAEVAVRGGEVDELEWLAGRDLPPAGPFSLRGHLSATPPQATISIVEARLAGSGLVGTVTIDLAGGRPRATGELNVGMLDFAALAALAGREEADEQDDGAPAILKTAAVTGPDFGVDVAVSFTVREVANAPVKAENLTLDLELGAGVLRLPFSGDVDVFSVEGELLAGGGRPRPHLRLSMVSERFDLASLRSSAPAGEGDEARGEAVSAGAFAAAGRYLKLLDADLSVTADRIEGIAFDARQVSLEGTLRDGVLSLPFRALLDGVPARGSLELKGVGEGLEASVDAAAGDVDLSVLSRRFPSLQSVEGRVGRVDASLSVRGSDLDSMKKGLSGRFAFENGDLAYRPRGGDSAVDITVEKGRLQLPVHGRIEGMMEGSLRGEPLGVDFILEGEHLFELQGPLELEAAATGGGGNLKLSGTFTRGEKDRTVALDFSLVGDRLGGLAAWTGLSPDSGGPYSLEGGLVVGEERWHLSIRSMALGESRLSGEVDMGPGETRPLMTASLRSEVLDLAGLQGIIKEGFSFPSERAPKGATGIPDVDLDLLVDRIPTAAGDITDLHTSLSLREGQVREAPFRASFDGALYGGNMHLALREGTLTADLFLSAEGVDGGSILEKAGAARGLEARVGRARLELHVSGSSVEDLGDSLRFTAQVGESRLALPDPHSDSVVPVEVNELILEWTSPRAMRLKFDGSIGGHAVTAGGHIETSREAGGATEKAAVRLDAAGFGGSLRLDGTFPLPFTALGAEMDFSLAGGKMESFNDLLDLSLPPLGPLRAGGRLRIDGEGYFLTGTEIAVGGTEVGGAVSLLVGGTKPRVEATFRADRVQLEDFALGEWSLVRTKNGEASAGEEKPEGTPLLHPEVLRMFEGDLAVDVGEVLSGENSLGGGSLRGRLEDDRLDLSLEVNLPAGNIALEAAFDAAEDPASTHLALIVENFNYGRLEGAVEGEGSARGTLDAVMEVTSRGEDFSEIMENASGRLDLTTWPIGLKTKIFDFWAQNIFFAVLPSIGAEGASRVNCLVGHFDMEKGVMTPRRLLIDSTGVRVRGSGRVDLKRGRIDMVLRPKAKRPQFFTLAAPVTVTGPLADPSIGPSPFSVVGVFVRHALSVITVPLRWIFEGTLPRDGGDVCLPPPGER